MVNVSSRTKVQMILQYVVYCLEHMLRVWYGSKASDAELRALELEQLW